MKLGIVGLPNVGKSTLFNAITNAGAESANYPFCTIDPNVGMVAVPDARLDKLSEMYHPKKTTPAVIEFVDIAGLVKGASRGEGLGNKFLSNIRMTDAIVHVVRCFDDENVIHVEGGADPARDMDQGHMGEQKHMDAENFREAVAHFRTMFLAPTDLLLSDEELARYDAEELTQLVLDKAEAAYARKEQEITPPLMRELERVIMLRVVDEYWMDNIDAMTELRQGIGLRAYAQNDPVVAYKEEGYEMFENMVAAIQEETLRRLFLVRLRQNEEVKRERVAKVTGESGSGDGTVRKQPVRKVVKIGRNDPCPCGSGLKWKKCTCAQYHPELK